MKRQSFFLFIFLATACKTSSRDEFGTQMSDITVKIPDDLTSYESKISFSRVDSSAKPKIVRGSEVKVKLPTGTYAVELALSDKSGTEIYRSCESEKTYNFLNPKEDAIIDICRSSDRSLIGKTLATTSAVDTTPTPSTSPSSNSSTPKDTTTEETKIGGSTNETTSPSIDDTPLFIEDRTCFGLPATYTRDGNEVVIKMTESIKDFTFDLTNAPRCTLLMNITKMVGQGFSPIHYKLTFTTGADTMKQNFYISSLVKDENGLKALPCRSMLLNSESNSGAAYQCSFYDTTPEKYLNVLDRDKTPYANSCAANSKQIKFDFYLNGALDKTLKDLTIPELRVQIPLAEPCITPSN